MYMAYDTNVYIHTSIHIAHVTAYTYAVICVAMSLCTHSATASPAPPLRHRLSVAVAAFFQAAMAGDTLRDIGISVSLCILLSIKQRFQSRIIFLNTQHQLSRGSKTSPKTFLVLARLSSTNACLD